MSTPKISFDHREQALANLRLLFGGNVDIVTIRAGYGYIAVATLNEGVGKTYKVMSGSGGSTAEIAVKNLHHLSAARLRQELEYDEELVREKQESCKAQLPYLAHILSRKPEASLNGEATKSSYSVTTHAEAEVSSQQGLH
ncbi:hypothetical protein BDV24DRAFT_169469 [Aspergillus arachidicola]|uniref:Uncharacterized protein n=1 Tax=Aspergillus arachidicola TaxID=656916 RepID=A0A5N6XPN7_9EURO|nr:hypothetical protein BDV24DRAFT_169469 [Aspergillus arachidicola]